MSVFIRPTLNSGPSRVTLTIHSSGSLPCVSFPGLVIQFSDDSIIKRRKKIHFTPLFYGVCEK